MTNPLESTDPARDVVDYRLATWSQDAMNLGQAATGVWPVVQRESAYHHVEILVGEGKRANVPDNELHSITKTSRRYPTPCQLHHLRQDVQADYLGLGSCLHKETRDLARATADVQH